MALLTSLARRLENSNLTRDQRAEVRCQYALQLTEKGEYESARKALGELWQRVGERPVIEGLEKSTAGEVLLRAGVLTGWIGDKQQIEDAQETAKNLISESISIFESLSYGKKILEAQDELALCYWREGRYEDARIILKDVLARLTTDSELKARAVLRLATVERGAGQYQDALRILINNALLFEKINSYLLKGSYHNALAVVYKNLGERLSKGKKRGEYIDRAFVEYAAASYHFELVEHKQYLANVENNLGFLYFKANRFKEAYEHLDRARRLLVSLKDKGTLAQVDETRARILIAQHRYREAERVIRTVITAMEKGGRLSLLAEALTTHGTVLAKLGYYEQARSSLQRAIDLAEQAGAPSEAAEVELKKITSYQLTPLNEDVRRHEHDLIKQALERTHGSVTQAARLLGISYQRLSYLIKTRHKDLLNIRTPIKRRRKSHIKKK
jgi:tetratricopeptide (TPR) repeat protein